MHELSVTQAIVEMCSEAARGARVGRVTVEVGKLSGVVPDALRFCYEICAKGTPLESSQLEIVEPAGRAKCRACGEDFLLEDPLGSCRCGSYDISCSGGRELRVKAMEVI
jgi:hydrogenase nickel incorporation protein HypA/HybF